jgi:hypothetical protein
MICFRYVIVNTVRKGDNNDNNNNHNNKGDAWTIATYLDEELFDIQLI